MSRGTLTADSIQRLVLNTALPETANATFSDEVLQVPRLMAAQSELIWFWVSQTQGPTFAQGQPFLDGYFAKVAWNLARMTLPLNRRSADRLEAIHLGVKGVQRSNLMQVGGRHSLPARHQRVGWNTWRRNLHS